MSLTFTLELPDDVERELHGKSSHLEAVAVKAVAIELFRLKKLSHLQLSQLLGLERFETDALLKRHKIEEQGMSAEDVAADVETLRRFLNERNT